jgi:sec-independent protein translocase protein TatA
MFGLGITEIVIIVVVLSIVFFGSKKTTDLAKTAGRFSGEFKRSKIEIEEEIKKVKENFKEGEKEN